MKCPERSRFGDPMYFEWFTGTDLEPLVADYKPPNNFIARIVLEEREVAIEELLDFVERTTQLYLAPAKTIDVYMASCRHRRRSGKQSASTQQGICQRWMGSVTKLIPAVTAIGENAWSCTITSLACAPLTVSAL